MNEQNRSYWFFIDPYVHVSVKNNTVLLYNPLSGKVLEYSNVPRITNLIRRLRSKKNLMVIKLKEKELDEISVLQFVKDIRKHFMGDLIDTSFSKGKPIQMMPRVKIQKDIKFRKNEPERSGDGNMMQYLSEVSLYINGECDLNCEICSGSYKQSLCCTKGNKKGAELDISKLKDSIEKIQYHLTGCVNILGGNIFKYSKLETLASALCDQPFPVIWYSHYSNLIMSKKRLGILDFDVSFVKILVNFPCNKEKFEMALELVRHQNIGHEVVFIIQDEDELNTAQDIISSLQVHTYSIHPYYSGNNMKFFEKNIFTNKEDILDAKPTQKDIYARGKVNPINFGKLTVLNNGSVHANVNAPRIGFLGKDSIHDLVFKEMYHGRSWRRTRQNVAPCRQCTFELMCPPLSNYEYALGKNNLCHIWNDRIMGGTQKNN